MLRAVFLDVGKTLLTEVPSRFEIYAEAARRRGVEVDAAAMEDEMRRAHRALPRQLEDGSFRYSDRWFQAYVREIFHARLGVPEHELGGLTEELFARFEDPRSFRSYPGAKELLSSIRRRGLTLGVISNWSARLPAVLAGAELADAFDFVLCSALEEMEKPESRLFVKALEHAGVAPDEALHAGDHLVLDVAAARAVGIEAVLVDHDGRFEGEATVEGALRVSGLAGLETVILERCA